MSWYPRQMTSESSAAAVIEGAYSTKTAVAFVLSQLEMQAHCHACWQWRRVPMRS
jgi:hypothetical protein